MAVSACLMRSSSVAPSCGYSAMPMLHWMEHAVTERVAEGVIDDLEAVEIQKQDGKARVALAGPLDGSVHTLRQQQAVGQAREYVSVGHLLKAHLGGVLQRHIPHEADARHQTLFVVAQLHP